MCRPADQRELKLKKPDGFFQLAALLVVIPIGVMRRRTELIVKTYSPITSRGV
jgi:hypothetical protein